VACFENLATGTETNPAYESLTNYLQLWAFALEQDPNALATPITTCEFQPHALRDGTPEDLVQKSTCMKIMLRPPKRYLSYKEQMDLEKGKLPDRKGAKVDSWSPGGIQCLLELLRIWKRQWCGSSRIDVISMEIPYSN
jgi:hypothetical protein